MRQIRLVLPEGLEVSPLFYYWLLGTVHMYLSEEKAGEVERKIFQENVLGISLSAAGLAEVRCANAQYSINSIVRSSPFQYSTIQCRRVACGMESEPAVLWCAHK